MRTFTILCIQAVLSVLSTRRDLTTRAVVLYLIFMVKKRPIYTYLLRLLTKKFIVEFFQEKWGERGSEVPLAQPESKQEFFHALV